MEIVTVREAGYLAGQDTILIMSVKLARAVSQLTAQLHASLDKVDPPVIGLVAELPDIREDPDVLIVDPDHPGINSLVQLPQDESLCSRMKKYRIKQDILEDLYNESNDYDDLYLVVTENDAFGAVSCGTGWTLYRLGLPNQGADNELHPL